MKIRTGFVSNSSSSSFVVAFPRKPETIEDVKEFLFGDRNADGMVSFYDHSYSKQQVAEQVLKDIKEPSKVLDTDTLAETLSSGWRYSLPSQSRQIKSMLEKPTLFRDSKYTGNSQESLRKLLELELEHKLREEEYDAKEREFRLKHELAMPWKQPKWPSEPTKIGDWDRGSKRPDTPEGVKYEKEMEAYKPLRAEYDRWNQEFYALQRADEDYQKFRQTRFDHDYWDKHSEILLECCKADAIAFQQENDGAFLAYFHYADEDGSFFATMEHGEIFHLLEHERISHH